MPFGDGRYGEGLRKYYSRAADDLSRLLRFLGFPIMEADLIRDGFLEFTDHSTPTSEEVVAVLGAARLTLLRTKSPVADVTGWREFFEALYTNEFHHPRQGHLLPVSATDTSQTQRRSDSSVASLDWDEQLKGIFEKMDQGRLIAPTPQASRIEIGEVWCTRCTNKPFLIDTGTCLVCRWTPGPSY